MTQVICFHIPISMMLPASSRSCQEDKGLYPEGLGTLLTSQVQQA